MKWMQFFTPAESINFQEAEDYITQHPGEDITILDVRQPKEYEESHIPGAVLIPLPQLSDRINEIDPEKPTLVYWAVGGRSRVAAQMLSGKGFKKVYNVSGGIKAWKAKTAIGPQTLGINLFDGQEEPLDVLKVAYSLEQGLRAFYLDMGEKAHNSEVKKLFAKLSEIEIKHQQSIFNTYKEMYKNEVSLDEFESMIESDALEGGLSTDEYLDLFKPDFDSPTEIISLAMSIEAQALDLYQRVGLKIENSKSKDIVNKIANEEKEHLASLGRLMDNIVKED